ncbi:MAG TPA: hypothetical protein VHY56_03990 [Candidatus Binataceae bacterium]|jgi:hypothetical protein|nr:hypothetical protein [Candidatus Binataceae bacterium]
MREKALNSSSSFPMAHCEACGKFVLTALAYDDNHDDGPRHRLCAHCDQPINSPLEWVMAAELEQRGYVFGAPAPSGKGCSSGGCGSSCGVRRN